MPTFKSSARSHFRKTVVVFFGAHQVDVLVAADPFLLAAGRDRPDLYHHGLGLVTLERELLHARLQKKPWYASSR